MISTKLSKHMQAIQEQLSLQGWRKMLTNKNGEDVVNTQETMRVEFNEDGTVNLLDFDMPSLNGRERLNVPQEEVAPWIIKRVSMLRITTEGDLVANLGFKVSDRVYYINSKQGESNE
jgi:hypothetical protein